MDLTTPLRLKPCVQRPTRAQSVQNPRASAAQGRQERSKLLPYHADFDHKALFVLARYCPFPEPPPFQKRILWRFQAQSAPNTERTARERQCQLPKNSFYYYEFYQ